MGTGTYLVQVPRQKEPPGAGRAPPSRQRGSPMGFGELGFGGIPLSAARGHGPAVSPRSGGSGAVAEGRKPTQCRGVEEGDGVAPSCPGREETGFWGPQRPSVAREPRGSGAPTRGGHGSGGAIAICSSFVDLGRWHGGIRGLPSCGTSVVGWRRGRSSPPPLPVVWSGCFLLLHILSIFQHIQEQPPGM